MSKWLTKNYIPLDWNVWTDSDKEKFANYWTEKYGTPLNKEDEEVKLETEETNCYIIETKEETLVIIGDEKELVKKLLTMKDIISIKEAKVNN